MLTLAWALIAAGVGATGVVSGTVRDTRGAPIRGAVVGIAGTTLYVHTDDAGRYRLAPVPAGEVRVRAAAIGYVPGAVVVVVATGDTVTADFALEPSPLELTPLDVVSSKVPRFGERPPTSVAQVTQLDIDRRAVNTIDEAIDKAPGVQLLNGQINIRGSTGYVQGLNSRVLLLVDGVPMNQGDRGGINWDLLPVDQIERVDVLKGAGSSLYGSAALGGVVNLTTRDVPAGTHGRVRVTGGVFGDPPHPEWEFRDERGLHGGFDIAASHGTESLAGQIAGGARHSDGYREQDARDHRQVAVKGRWQATPRTRVDASGAWAVDEYDVPLSWCSRSECDDRGQIYQPFKVDTTELGAHTVSRKGYAAAQVRTVLSERFAWQARGSWLRTHFTDVRRSATDFSVANRLGAELRAESHPSPGRTVLVGAEATSSDVASDIFGSHSQWEFAAYGESEQPIGAGASGARMSAGARIDFLAVDGGSFSAVVSPRVGVTYRSMRASVGRGFRAPTMAERFVRTTALGFEIVPNPNLRPETAWSFEIGHRSGVVARMLRFDAAVFWTEAEDLIEPALISGGAGTQIQLQNVARARIAGLDATVLAAPWSDRLTASLAYTYLYARSRGAGGDYDTPLAFRPRHLLTLSADYTQSSASVGADLRFSSRPERIELEGFVDPRRVAVQVLDVRAGWRAGALDLRLLLANALGYIYNLVPETLAPVRTLSLTALWSY